MNKRISAIASMVQNGRGSPLLRALPARKAIRVLLRRKGGPPVRSASAGVSRLDLRRGDPRVRGMPGSDCRGFPDPGLSGEQHGGESPGPAGARGALCRRYGRPGRRRRSHCGLEGVSSGDHTKGGGKGLAVPDLYGRKISMQKDKFVSEGAVL